MESRNLYRIYESIDECVLSKKDRPTRQSLENRFNEKREFNDKSVGNDSKMETSKSWSENFSICMSNVNPKQALRNGADKISHTFNNVRTTIGSLSQKLRRSTRRRHQLKCTDSPLTPMTKTRLVLGRTPTKLYSPFSIETPRGKENSVRRTPKRQLNRTSPRNAQAIVKRKFERNSSKTKFNGINTLNDSDPIFEKDLFETQVGIYDFQHTANKIVSKCLRN